MCNDIELPLSFSHYFILSCMTLFSYVSTKNMVFVPLIIAFQCILLVHKVSGSISKIHNKESDEENTDKTNKTDKKGGSFGVKELGKEVISFGLKIHGSML